MSRFFAFLIVAALAPAASASSQTLPDGHRGVGLPVSRVASATADPAPLKGEQIRVRIVGNTIDGVDDGKAYSEYIVSDGTLRGLGADGFFSGTWRIDKNQFCYRIDPDADPDNPDPTDSTATWEWECSQVTLVGAKLYWSDGIDEGDAPDATLRDGNPSHL